MLFLRWILGCVVLTYSICLMGFNNIIFWKSIVKREKAPSWIPLVGGVSAALAFLALPIIPLHKWWWLPLILDWGSLPGIVVTLIWNIWYKVKHRSD